ncbi:hypothetical protein [Parafrankia sp. CH37]|uniref:hypothetical protein n=1 Tax=Parafrankia sp. CH37 TaxID=683308 RepID=UPI001041DC32|nr:hypothetical protein [Parafrankia sp. CH37]
MRAIRARQARTGEPYSVAARMVDVEVAAAQEHAKQRSADDQGLNVSKLETALGIDPLLRDRMARIVADYQASAFASIARALAPAQEAAAASIAAAVSPMQELAKTHQASTSASIARALAPAQEAAAASIAAAVSPMQELAKTHQASTSASIARALGPAQEAAAASIARMVEVAQVPTWMDDVIRLQERIGKIYGV